MTKINWNSYAWTDNVSPYQLMCDYNPEYHKLIEENKKMIKKLSFEEDVNFSEWGSGLGDALLGILHKVFPKNKISSFELNDGFYQLQKQKIESLRKNNIIKVYQKDITIERKDGLVVEDESLDLLLINHVINFLPEKQRDQIMVNVNNALKKGGYLLINDIGRPIPVGKCTETITDYFGKIEGYENLPQFLAKTVSAIAQNVQARALQDSGHSFMHTLDTFVPWVESYSLEKIKTRDDLYWGIDDTGLFQKI